MAAAIFIVVQQLNVGTVIMQSSPPDGSISSPCSIVQIKLSDLPRTPHSSNQRVHYWLFTLPCLVSPPIRTPLTVAYGGQILPRNSAQATSQTETETYH